MKIEKRVLSPLPSCYSVMVAPFCGEPHAVFASEADDACLAFRLADPSRPRVVWTHPGGTMGMVPIPGREDEFLAVQKFYRLWNWEESELVWVRREGERFAAVPVFRMPYLHRFDILTRSGRLYLLVCGVAARKTSLDDWSCPGSVLAGPLPDGPDGPFDLRPLRLDFYKNHGYSRVTADGTEAGFVTCADGGFLFTPPETAESPWRVEKIIDGNFSDGDMTDIDGDGALEIAAISPFHGDHYAIYKKLDGRWKEVFSDPEPSDFYHVVRAGVLGGRPGFLGGGRGGRERLFFVAQDGPSAPFELLPIDEGQGPSNACIYNGPDGDIVLAANRNAGEAVLYRIGP